MVQKQAQCIIVARPNEVMYDHIMYNHTMRHCKNGNNNPNGNEMRIRFVKETQRCTNIDK